MLKNAYSKSSIANIFSDIEKTLIAHGAKNISRDFIDGKVSSLSFVIQTKRGDVVIRLPARTGQIENIFQSQGLKYKEGQPYRTAWATIRDWVSAQMALIEWEMVQMEEIFLPYMVHKNGQTFFEVFQVERVLLENGE